MAVIRQYTKKGVVVKTFASTGTGTMCYLDSGYFLQQAGRSLSLYKIDGSVIRLMRGNLVVYFGTDFSGKGVAVDHSHGLNETEWDGKDVFTLEQEDLIIDVGHFRHYVWDKGNLTLVNSVSLGSLTSVSGLEYDGHRVWLGLFITAPGNYNVRQFDYSGKSLVQLANYNFGTTHPVTDIAFDGEYMWRLRATVPEVVQDSYNGKTRNAMQIWTPIGTTLSGIMTDGTYIYIASAS